jgi:hypothetical protein
VISSLTAEARRDVAVSIDRRVRLWGRVVERAHGEPVTVAHVCAVAVAAAGVTCAAVTVVLSAALRETIHVTDGLASALEELSLTLGEGPGVDALAHGPVLVADLMTDDCSAGWPAFAPAAARAGSGLWSCTASSLASWPAGSWPTRCYWRTRRAHYCSTRHSTTTKA